MGPIDFQRPTSQPRLGWLILLVGSVCVAAASRLSSRYEAARVQAAGALEEQHDLARQRARPVPAMAPTQADVRTRTALAQSDAPLLGTLRAIERTAQDPVYLRSLNLDPAAHTVKLEAEAPTFADALAYVQTLDAEPLLHPAMLTAHNDVPEQVSGKTHLTFTVMTRWNRR